VVPTLEAKEDRATTMDATILLVALGLLITAALLIFPRKTARARVKRLTNLLPGPKSYPIIGSQLPFIMLDRKDLMRKKTEEINQYTPLYRTWMGHVPEVTTLNPAHLEIILGSSKNITKSFAYKFLHPWLGTGLLTSTGQKWHTHRKMITPTFHFKILDSFVEVFSEKSEILISKLRKEVGSKGFDVFPYVTKCTLDIICETAMGTPINAQEDKDSDYVSAVYKMSTIIVHRLIRPWLYLDWIFTLTGGAKNHDECLRVLHGFTKRVIQERKVLHAQRQNEFHTSSSIEDVALGKKRRLAFLDLLLEASHDGIMLTDEELREEVDTFMFEGHDTTSAGICWAIYLLGLHTDIQNKVSEELEHIFQGSDRSVTMKDLNEMKYLERVIKESLRLYPSVPFIGREITEDIKLDNYTIPAGVTLSVPIIYIHRNPDQFPDPEKFDPDNFLPERVAKRHPYAYIPFSAGPRNCIGQKFAMLEMKTVLSYILRHYSLRSLDKREDITLIGELVLRTDEGLKVIVTPRK